jgi:hypothetical protein
MTGGNMTWSRSSRLNKIAESRLEKTSPVYPKDAGDRVVLGAFGIGRAGVGAARLEILLEKPAGRREGAVMRRNFFGLGYSTLVVPAALVVISYKHSTHGF